VEVLEGSNVRNMGQQNREKEWQVYSRRKLNRERWS